MIKEIETFLEADDCTLISSLVAEVEELIESSGKGF